MKKLLNVQICNNVRRINEIMLNKIHFFLKYKRCFEVNLICQTNQCS